MAASDQVFAGSVPEIYDRYLVPLIFESYARDLAGRVAQTGPARVLETAAGTGVLTRAMAASLPANVAIAATDLNQPMLDRAAATLAGDARITWRQADALALPFDGESFDVVACQFGVMFFPDKVRGYAQARRVLKRNGRLFFNVWNAIALNPFADVVTEAVTALFPADPPRFLARTPHGYHDAAQIRQDVAAAGFADVALETLEMTSRASSPRDVAVAFCQGTPLRNEIEARGAAALEDATEAATQALARQFGSGPIEGRISAHVVTAGKSNSE
jgi:ubiquinone/menaquinone biosynthesis C-methylase UbiE